MGDRTGIEWTDATWNPVRGCSIVSPGCTHCYAMKQAHRFSGPGGAYEGLTKLSKNGGPVWTGDVRVVPELLEQPIRWTRPRRIFVNSMSDLFHEAVPFKFIDRVFKVMSCTTRHTYQVLTKRPARMLEYFQYLKANSVLFADDKISEAEWPTEWKPTHGGRGGYDNCGPHWPYRNVWLGVSVENQKTADERIPLLLQAPAAVRWLSCEPLLGALDLRGLIQKRCVAPEHPFPFSCREPSHDIRGIDWVVAGGESGPRSRPMHPEWVRRLRYQCQAAGVPFLFKQWGDWQISSFANGHLDQDMARNDAIWLDTDGRQQKPSSHGLSNSAYAMVKVGKKRAGRELDGMIHDEYPHEERL